MSIITGSWLLLVVLWLSGSKSLKPNIIYSLRLSTNDGTPYKESPEVISSYFGNLVKTGLFQNRNPLSFGDCVYCIHPTKQQIDSSSVTILTTPQISSFLSFVNIRVRACLLLSLRTNRSNLLYLSHTTSYTHRLTVLLLGLVICKTN